LSNGGICVTPPCYGDVDHMELCTSPHASHDTDSLACRVAATYYTLPNTTGCPTRYWTWLAGRPLLCVATIWRTTDTFLFISHTTNVPLFKVRCNISIGVRIIKEMPGSVASGTHCIKKTWDTNWESLKLLDYGVIQCLTLWCQNQKPGVCAADQQWNVSFTTKDTIGQRL
jgi:hypothetical protein